MQRIDARYPIWICLFLSCYAGSSILNEPVDISPDFADFSNLYYCADRLAQFDPGTASGRIIWSRAQYQTRLAFNNMLAVVRPTGANEFPNGEYETDPNLPFVIEFISPRTIRIRIASGPRSGPDEPSLMFATGTVQKGTVWNYERVDGGYRYSSDYGSVTVLASPFHIEFRDQEGKLLTKTFHLSDGSQTFTPILPFSFVRRASDYSRSICAVFTLSPGERIFGCGESFTAFDKRGQKVVLWTDDSNGTQNQQMYKPIPFFMTSSGYGMFMHTSSPITCDFGYYYNSVMSLMIGDDQLDLFVFFGQPKEILDEYTRITGKSPVPPLWSFGLWMSRCTYFSEKQTRQVAARLRQERIPCDVIHLDTGWFETDWRCDYQFSKARFDDPQRMIADLKAQGFRISLWQLPYFVPKNTLFAEIIERGLMVRDAKGDTPYEDAVLDFSNPAAVGWYQEKIASLLRMGVGAIKVDFGEAAPAKGLYASGRTGFYEHNLYPLRYNKAVAEVTKLITGQDIIWARSAWAGSQRYPVHWGGDAESTDGGMAATLRAGLSFGLCGFSFWSHDVGGFVSRAPDDLYLRWLAFGVLTSHTRCHGTAPKEPWEYGPSVMDQFRRIVELKYRLMPYVYAQAHDCSRKGLPMLRALFVEFPQDPGSWLIDDEYLFGSSILVAPLLQMNTRSRDVYLPPGRWIDYQTGADYAGGWHHIKAGQIPILILVRDGTVLPHIQLAQSTDQMDWSRLELVVFAKDLDKAEGLVCLPEDKILSEVRCLRKDGAFQLEEDPMGGKVSWTIRAHTGS